MTEKKADGEPCRVCGAPVLGVDAVDAEHARCARSVRRAVRAGKCDVVIEVLGVVAEEVREGCDPTDRLLELLREMAGKLGAKSPE